MDFARELLLNTDVHPESAPAEVEEALRFVGDESRGDLEKAAAGVDDDAGFAQDGELLGDDGGAPASSPGDLGDHERAAIGQLAHDVPASGAADAIVLSSASSFPVEASVYSQVEGWISPDSERRRREVT